MALPDMSKTFTYCSLLLLGVSPAFAAQPFGLANSQQPFEIQRGEGTLLAPQTTPFLVNEGDVLRPGAAHLRMDTINGGSLLVGNESVLEISHPLRYTLRDGRAALSFPAGETDTRIVASELEFRRIGHYDNSGEREVQQVALGTNPSGSEVAIISNGGMVAVTSILSGEQIAIVGMDEVMGFIRDHLGNWTIVVPTMQETERELDGVGESEGEEGVLGLIPSFFGAGAAGTAGAAAVIGGLAAAGLIAGAVELTSDSSDRADESTAAPRPFATGILPPQQQPPENGERDPEWDYSGDEWYDD